MKERENRKSIEKINTSEAGPRGPVAKTPRSDSLNAGAWSDLWSGKQIPRATTRGLHAVDKKIQNAVNKDSAYLNKTQCSQVN